jgi:predicted O-methyltransferase YrrM
MHVQELLKQEEFQTLRKEILSASDAETETSKKAQGISQNQETQALASKAPGRHQNRLKMLEQMPKDGRCAEIGVWSGGFSGAILEVTQPTELVLIDPWDLLSAQSEEEWTHQKHKNHVFMSELYANVENLYGQLDNVKIRKGFSAEVLSSYPDNYFDWVYIDGNHLYDFVKKDIDIAFEKVRPGGIIAGDDFFWKRDNRMHVREAVFTALREHGIEGKPKRLGQQFMITVPE